MKRKLIPILFCCFSFLFNLRFVAGHIDHELVLETEQIKRHLEIRRELEKDATPFLKDNQLAPDLSFMTKIYSSAGFSLTSIPTSWMDFLTTFSLFDLTMGIFSLLALGFGLFYFVWRMNPFASKIEK